MTVERVSPEDLAKIRDRHRAIEQDPLDGTDQPTERNEESK